LRKLGVLLSFGLVLAWAACVAPDAGAWTEWDGNCSVEAEPVNHHCYALARRAGVSKYADIVYMDTEGMYVPGAKGYDTFISNETWISFNANPGEWIETGTIAGIEDCCSLHEFYDEQYHGRLQEHFHYDEIPVPGSPFEQYLIFDPEQNGRWHIYWAGAGSCGEWCEVAVFGGGWPTAFNTQEAGAEVSTPSVPYNYGRDEVAASNGGAWEPWTGATYHIHAGFNWQHNPVLPAEGNIAWSVGSPPGAALVQDEPMGSITQGEGGEVAGKVTREPDGTTLTTYTGTTPFHANWAPVPYGRKAPRGNVLSVQRDSEGHIVGRYLAATPPTQEELDGGLPGGPRKVRLPAMEGRMMPE